MSKYPCNWDSDDRLKEISAKGGPRKTLAGAVDFLQFRPTLEKAAGRPQGQKGDAVRRAIKDRVAEPWFLPSYSPDPLKQMFAKLVHSLRKAKVRGQQKDLAESLRHLRRVIFARRFTTSLELHPHARVDRLAKDREDA